MSSRSAQCKFGATPILGRNILTPRPSRAAAISNSRRPVAPRAHPARPPRAPAGKCAVIASARTTDMQSSSLNSTISSRISSARLALTLIGFLVLSASACSTDDENPAPTPPPSRPPVEPAARGGAPGPAALAPQAPAGARSPTAAESGGAAGSAADSTLARMHPDGAHRCCPATSTRASAQTPGAGVARRSSKMTFSTTAPRRSALRSTTTSACPRSTAMVACRNSN